jgi:hypothetical protein
MDIKRVIKWYKKFAKTEIGGEPIICKPLFGENYYAMSTGDIVSAKRSKYKIIAKERVTGGYNRVSLMINKKNVHFAVHRLIASAFLDNPLNLPTVNHKNGVPSDNRLSNLEYASRSDQALHSLYVLGHYNRKTRSVCQVSLQGTLIATYKSVKEAAKVAAVSGTRLGKICRSKVALGDYFWFYKDEYEKEISGQGVRYYTKFSVDQYNLDGNFIQSFKSKKAAITFMFGLTGKSAERLTLNIAQACDGLLNSAFGYIWKTPSKNPIIADYREEWDIHPFYPNYRFTMEGECYSTISKKLININMKTDYPTISITDINGKKRSRRLHILIAELYVIKPPGKNYVNHIDCQKNNFSAWNLEWVTHPENMKHARDNGLIIDTMSPVIQFDLVTKEELARFPSIKKAAKSVGCDPSNIGRVCAGYRKTSCGFGWKFEKNENRKSR